LISSEAEVLRDINRPEEALKLVQQFARENWWHYSASLAAGRLYAQLNDVPNAQAALWQASWLDVHEVEALDLLAKIALRTGKFEEAYDIQRHAIARQPDQPRQYALMSEILEKMGRKQQAEESLAAAQLLVKQGRAWTES
jgi:tetratricopeptide (TPR) repeat protein